MQITSSKKLRLSPAQLIPISFLAAILIGTLLLLLPVSSAPGQQTDFITALFTATTSVCVTGLVVVDTASHFSTFGHVIILLLIQIGGLGIVAVISLLMLLLHRRFSLSDAALLQDAFGLDTRAGVFSFLKRVFSGTLLVEGIGALCYAFSFVPLFGPIRGLWFSVFTAISAFCNAGIDLIGPDSFIPFQTNAAVLLPTMMLIILGSLGFVVWFDVIDTLRDGHRKRIPLGRCFFRLGEHTRLVLLLTTVLIFGGAAFFFFTEGKNSTTLGALSGENRVLGALFQSITLRTAGFAAVPQGNLTDLSTLGALLFMFIGGSPIGTAGGVKTVTFFLVILNAVSFILGRDETVLFGRRVPEELMRRASAVVAVCISAVVILTMLLMAVTGFSAADAAYEITSACATVGLSRGITGQLNTAGRLVVILAMYLGRIGPISMALFFARSPAKENRIRHPAGRFFAG